MASRYQTRNGRTAKRGLFSSGIWHCDCEPRMPADKFQTKNGGKNHGRWFYTCQKPQPKRCTFFLWEDDAKVREEGAVLSNSRSEPANIEPRTPKKIGRPAVQTKITAQIPTPSTKSRSPVNLEAVPPPSKQDSFDWPSDDDGDLAEALEEFETPRKAARTATITSPSKRNSNESGASNASSTTIRNSSPDDVFRTPATHARTAPAITAPDSPLSHKTFNPNTNPKSSGLASPKHTPATVRSHQPSSPTGSDSLTDSVLSLLRPHKASLPSDTMISLTTLLQQHELRTAGIVKGRDISRLAVQAKERKIAELQQRIQGLELERETMRSVVQHLKRDMVESTRRGKKPGGGGGRGRGRRGSGDGDGRDIMGAHVRSEV